MKIKNKDEIRNNNRMLKIQSDTNFLKEDLEKYYIDEKKTITEISEIYKCSWNIIKRKLKKYNIPIRPHGSFLVSSDGETLNSKLIKGEISSSEYYNKRAKEKGFDNSRDYNSKMNHIRGVGTGLSMSENKDCSKYLGVYIAERLLPLLFENVERMPEDNPGFDFICNHGYKVDVKSACLGKINRWIFVIKENKIADYFFMVAFDNRNNLNVMHMWLIKGNSVIEKIIFNSEEFVFNERYTINIGKGNKSLKRWKKYEKIDILEKAQKLCNIFKEKCDYKVDYKQLGD